tara:strand:- start:506 stop:1063 length:558 start_codon:yes stop_codon:yes gene_type:complete
MSFILQPWPWYISGALIAIIMLFLLLFGKSFGFSSNLRTLCTMCGADKYVPFFEFNWKSQSWNILFLVGTGIGGWLAANYLSEPGYIVAISQDTINDLTSLGFNKPNGYVPEEHFGLVALQSVKGFLVLATGGLLVGFGARYAGGCTSGHAISGISNLQPASLLAVVGFFIGGLVMTHLLFPLIY